MEQEIWKPIRGFEGLYEVSNLGRIKSLRKTVSRFVNAKLARVQRGEYILKPHAAPYCMATLHDKNGETIVKSVHRIVAETFVPNPMNLPVVNHKDENKLNNAASNLEWCTQSYNLRYSHAKKRNANKI